MNDGLVQLEAPESVLTLVRLHRAYGGLPVRLGLVPAECHNEGEAWNQIGSFCLQNVKSLTGILKLGVVAEHGQEVTGERLQVRRCQLVGRVLKRLEQPDQAVRV